jgi:IMP dehydrogenase
MKTVGDILRHDPVWVHPTQEVEAAIALMRDHQLSGLPVLDGINLVGMTYYKNLLGVESHHRIGEVMEPITHVISPTLSIREAATILTNEHLECLPVVREGAVLGILTASDLLAELRDLRDPLTDLPWSDSLREWGIQALRAGIEITILFIDVNDFGQFNKRFGHVVGDTVLRHIADVLRELDDPERSIVCRYGGDEFCIATQNSAESAAELGAKIVGRVARIHVPEMLDQPISVTVGQYGGKRTREREHTHYAATLNNLINLASRDCIRKKPQLHPQGGGEGAHPPDPASIRVDNGLLESSATSVEAPGPEPALSGPVSGEWVSFGPDRIHVRALDIGWNENVACVRVELERVRPDDSLLMLYETERSSLEEERRSGASKKIVVTYACALTRRVDRNGLPRLVAEAVVAALECALPMAYRLRVEEVFSVRTTETRELITTVGRAISETKAIPFVGTSFAGEERYSAVALSALKAVSLLSILVKDEDSEPNPSSEL